MVYLKALAPVSLFKLLFRIDVALAAEVQAAGRLEGWRERWIGGTVRWCAHWVG